MWNTFYHMVKHILYCTQSNTYCTLQWTLKNEFHQRKSLWYVLTVNYCKNGKWTHTADYQHFFSICIDSFLLFQMLKYLHQRYISLNGYQGPTFKIMILIGRCSRVSTVFICFLGYCAVMCIWYTYLPVFWGSHM